MFGTSLRAISRVAFVILTANLGVSAALAADAAHKSHRLVFEVDTADAGAMNMTLANAMNAKRYYDSKGEPLSVEIVALGQGITMLRGDTSPVKDGLEALRKNIPGLALSMCGNTKAGMEKSEGHEIPVLPGVTVVPAGIARLVDLEEQGWSYVRR